MTTPRPHPTRRVNRVVVGILRSGLHRVLSGVLVEIRYRGRRSGRWYSLPAQYATDEGRPDTVVVYPGHPDRKVWWRSFLEDAEAILVVRGVERRATGVIVDGGGADRRWAVDTYTHRFRKVRVPDGAPLVVFTLDA
jgi:hypothetical protein